MGAIAKAPPLDKEEQALGRYIFMTDIFGMIPLTIGYVFFGYIQGDRWINKENVGLFGGLKPNYEMPFWLRIIAVVCAIGAQYSLFLHVFGNTPVYKNTLSKFKVMQGFGRWSFLTRWCLAMQAIHHTLGAIVAINQSFWPFAGIFPAAAPLSGCVGVFVTVQFFCLVYPSPRFKHEIGELEKQGYGKIMQDNIITHGLCLPLALFDACLFQPSIVQWVPVADIFFSILIFCLFYLFIIFVNYYITNEWPYQVLVNNGTSVLKWSKFIAMQTGFIFCLDLFLRLSRYATPRVW